MGHHGILIGEVVARSGVSRKAVRLYEASGILPAPARTPAGYRVYGAETLELLAFVSQARRLGLSLAEIQEMVEIRRSGHAPCPHVHDLVQRRAAEIDRQLANLTAVRQRLHALLASWRGRRWGRAVVCPHIEHADHATRRRKTR